MSGIIGSAGSKSGVIGETTMRYEEGSFTPTFGTSSGAGGSEITVSPAGKAYYIRNGSMVTIFVQWSGSWSGTITTIRNLPFNVDQPTAGYSLGNVLNNSTGNSAITRFEDTEWMYVLYTASGNLHIATGSYITDSP